MLGMCEVRKVFGMGLGKGGKPRRGARVVSKNVVPFA